jgi:DNA repair protein RadD
MITLRDYQREAVDAIYSWFEKASGNPLIVIPTGGGKSACIAMFCREVVEQWPDQRILIVTHVKELIAQNHAMMVKAWPEGAARTGIYSAGLGRRDNRAQILFAGIQSVHKKTEEIGSFDLVLVDEAHLIPREGAGRYLSMMQMLRVSNPKVKMIGFTATPFRLGEGSLNKGDGAMFDGIAYDCDMLKLIDAKWLAPVTAKSAEHSIDTSDVGIRGGEFIESELEDAAMQTGNVEAAVAELVARGKTRKAWLVFGCSVSHSQAIAAELRRYNIPTVEIYGDTPRDERDAAVAAIRSGEARCAVNVQVLTTGFDAPHIDLIALLRPTMSAGLYVQMIGRGMRPAPGKLDCLVLDFSGNVMRHGPVNAVVVREPGEKASAEAPVKECPDCGALVGTATTVCGSVVGVNEQTGEPILCTYEWETARGAATHEAKPDEEAEVLRTTGPRWVKVTSTFAVRHSKPGGKDSLRFTYRTGSMVGKWMAVSEWVCFEHDGFAKRKAGDWWLNHGGKMPVPETIEDAMWRIEYEELKVVEKIQIDDSGEYVRVVDFRAYRPLVHGGDQPGKTPPAGDVDYSDIPF